MSRVRIVSALAWSLALATAFAQTGGHAPEARVQAPPAVAAEAAAVPGDDAGAWLRRMLASERAFDFATTPVERSTLPPVAAGGGFAWPAGATLETVRTNFEARWIGRERAGGRPVVVIELAPRHEGPAWRFWIDAATGARVAYRATLGDGRVVAEGRGDATALVRAVGAVPLPAPRVPDDARAAAWRVAFGGLEGFEPVDVRRVRLAGGVPALRVTLWDGLTGVVMLAYQATRAAARGEWMTTRSNRNLTLALVGPVPEATADAYLAALLERRWARSDLEALLRRWGGRAEGTGAQE